jgi:hypothetical protein
MILTLALAAALTGLVQDATGLPLPGAIVELIDEGRHATTTASGVEGTFSFAGLAPGRYRLRVTFAGFAPHESVHLIDIDRVEQVRVVLAVQAVREDVSVHASDSDLPTATTMQSIIDRGLIDTLPSQSVSGGLSAVLTLASPGVAADSNGGFHPLGEHAETSFSIDGQPIADQQSRTFSNQLSAAAIQTLEVLTGVPPAEFGDKTSLVVKATTRSGLATRRPAGSASIGYGAFGSLAGSLSVGAGTDRIGNFTAIDSFVSDRFLDAPEHEPLHDRGFVHNIFNRLDARVSGQTAVQVNLFAAASRFQAPNTLDQQDAGQDQRQHQWSVNVAPSVTHTFGTRAAFDALAWFRHDTVAFDGSADRSRDRPAALSQRRTLSNAGVKTVFTYAAAGHTLRLGAQQTMTWLAETFETGLTDPAFNPPCFTLGGAPAVETVLRAPAQCAAAGLVPNDGFLGELLPFDLTRGGSPFDFSGHARIAQTVGYAQYSLKTGAWETTAGLRVDRYDGLSAGTGVQPRLGASYRIDRTGTAWRASYGRIFLTPYNENLVLASSTSGVLGSVAASPLTPGDRQQFGAGVHQHAKGIQIDAEYFWKFTDGAYDFDIVLNTPLAFPVQFRESKVDGGLVRVTFPAVRGWQAFTTVSHTRARLFGPALGGLRFSGDYAPVARPDHDQAFQQTTHVEYQSGRRGFWAGLTWRFDSGLVAVSVPTYAAALRLSGDEQAAMGLYCGGTAATRTQPLRSCSDSTLGATRIDIPPPGTENDDTNPPRIVPRHLVDAATGIDLLAIGAARVQLRITVLNVFDRVALYNFLSTFSGTHFVAPRSARADVSVRF